MEKKTSYAEISSTLNDKSIVVLEFGRQYTRCGFAGEPAPRAIIRTCVYSRGKRNHLDRIKDTKELQEAIGEFIENIYFNHLAVSPKEKKVVVVESVFCRSIFRTLLTRVFFDQFNVPSILFVPDHLMALATIGCSTGLVVDLGADEAVSIAVVSGVTLLDASQFASLGARTLDSHIKDELIKHNPKLKEFLKPDIVEDIRLKACFVAPFERGCKLTLDKINRSKEIQMESIRLAQENGKEVTIGNMEKCYFLGEEDDQTPVAVNYPILDLGTIDIPGQLREGACEIFFEIFCHEHSLTTMIIETILSAPIDCRKSLAENILVIGGLANLPGLEHRLSEELRNINAYQRFRRKIPDKFKFHRAICPKNYVSWLGASLFCTPTSIELRSTTRDQWLKDDKRNLREWSDFIK